MYSKLIMQTETHIDNSKYMRLATYASVSVAILLVLVKIYAWFLSGSVSIMASVVDSILDLIVSFLNLLAVRYALQPPDEEHRFGHNSAEDVAALAQSAFIAGSAIFILFAAIGKFSHPAPITHSGIGIAVMAFSIIATLLLVTFQKFVVRKTGSTVIEADSLHYVGDIFMNAAVIIALILSTYFDFQYADPIFAIIIAIYIFRGSWKIGRLAFDKLMDKEFDLEEKQKIIDYVNSIEEAKGIHELKTRYSGIKPFIQFHLELDGNLTLKEAHDIADKIERKLKELFPQGEVIIHQDPA